MEYFSIDLPNALLSLLLLCAMPALYLWIKPLPTPADLRQHRGAP